MRWCECLIVRSLFSGTINLHQCGKCIRERYLYYAEQSNVLLQITLPLKLDHTSMPKVHLLLEHTGPVRRPKYVERNSLVKHTEWKMDVTRVC